MCKRWLIKRSIPKTEPEPSVFCLHFPSELSTLALRTVLPAFVPKIKNPRVSEPSARTGDGIVHLVDTQHPTDSFGCRTRSSQVVRAAESGEGPLGQSSPVQSILGATAGGQALS